MGVKYVKDFEFPKGAGFSGSCKPMKKAMGGKVDGSLNKIMDAVRRSPQAQQMMQRPEMAEAERPMMEGAERPMMEAAPQQPTMMRKGGKVTGKKAQAKVGKVMREFKEGKLHSGKDGPKVKNPKQAMAIALSEARSMKKADGGEVSKGPKTRGTARKGREQGRKKAMERWANQRMRHAEKYAPGMDLDNIHDAEIKEASKKADRYQKGGIIERNAARHEKIKQNMLARRADREARVAAMRSAVDARRKGRPISERILANRAERDAARQAQYARQDANAARRAQRLGLGPAAPEGPPLGMKTGGDVKKAVHKHEKAMHPGKPLTKLKRGGLPVHQGSPMYGKK